VPRCLTETEQFRVSHGAKTVPQGHQINRVRYMDFWHWLLPFGRVKRETANGNYHGARWSVHRSKTAARGEQPSRGISVQLAPRVAKKTNKRTLRVSGHLATGSVDHGDRPNAFRRSGVDKLVQKADLD
jgi:hypothetical protein